MPSHPINPRKLVNSKWTSVKLFNKEKHFVVTEVGFDDEGLVTACIFEAVMSKRAFPIQWQELKNRDHWIQGWK